MLAPSVQNRFVRLSLAALIGLGSGLLFLTLTDVPAIRRVEWMAKDLRWRTSSFEHLKSDDVVMVLIDDHTVRLFRESLDKQPPYRWPIHEWVLKYILSGNPDAVVYDLLFVRKGYSGEKQELRSFARLHENEPVVHPLKGTNTAGASRFQAPSVTSVKGPSDSFNHLLQFDHLEGPVDPLLKFSAAAGTFNVRLDPDDIFRRYPLFIRHGDQIFPSLGLASARTVSPATTEPVLEKTRNGYRLSTFEHPLSVSRDGTRPVFWYGPPGTFEFISFGDVATSVRSSEQETSPKVPADRFQNKIVLIASNLTSQMLNRPTDVVPTPMSGNYIGPEIHATVISNLLKNHRTISLPQWGRYVLHLGLATASALLTVFFVRIRWQLLLNALLLVSFLGTTFFLFQLWHVDLSIVPPVLAAFTAMFSTGVLNYFTEGQRRKFIRENFRRLVPRPAVEELEDNFDIASAEIGETREVTVLFSDIRGFTDFSEQHRPEEVVQFLNLYFDEMIQILMDHHGTFDKYIGDAILGYFGAPHSLDEPERLAVDAAREMIARATSLKERSDLPKPESLQIGIGLNTDDIVLGFMGGQDRVEYTAIGDGVNLASRLEGLTKRYGVELIISEKTQRRLDDDVLCRCLDRVRVKGKQEAVDIFEVCGHTRESTELQRFVQTFNAAVRAYRERDWGRAIEALEYGLSLKPNDRPCRILLDRIQTLKDDPPGEHWDFTEKLTEK